MEFNIDNYEVSPHPKTKNWVYVWEPLDADVPESAKPYCCYGSTVIFYADDEHKIELGRTEHKITHSFRGDTNLIYRESHFFLMSGQVVWHNNKWFMEWTATKPSATLEEEDDGGFWCQGDRPAVRQKSKVKKIKKDTSP